MFQSLSTVKELHFKRKANCGRQCGILTDCFGSYCILLVFVNYSDFVPQAQGGKYQYFPPNWLIFPSKLGSSGNITLNAFHLMASHDTNIYICLVRAYSVYIHPAL